MDVVARKGEGLAAGLTSVFRHFSAADGQQVIAFDSDSPHLTPSILDSAFELVATRDLVLGLSNDGGYYLLGAKAHPSLFESKGMGTGSALDRLFRRTKVLGLSVRFADPFCDIDVAEDLIRLAAELQRAPTPPQTATRLNRWGDAMRKGAGDL